MERVTDDQFALLDGRIRHVPGGVDEYLRLLDARSDARERAKPEKPQRDAAEVSDQSSAKAPAMPRAEEYALKKELASTERKLETLAKRVDAVRIELEDADPTDYVGLVKAQSRLNDTVQELLDLENEWMRLSERLSS